MYKVGDRIVLVKRTERFSDEKYYKSKHYRINTVIGDVFEIVPFSKDSVSKDSGMWFVARVISRKEIKENFIKYQEPINTPESKSKWSAWECIENRKDMCKIMEDLLWNKSPTLPKYIYFRTKGNYIEVKDINVGVKCIAKCNKRDVFMFNDGFKLALVRMGIKSCDGFIEEIKKGNPFFTGEKSINSLLSDIKIIENGKKELIVVERDIYNELIKS